MTSASTKLNDKLAFCRHWCGSLTESQEIMLRHCIEKNTFLGIGREVGRSIYSPLVSIGKAQHVINADGYYVNSVVESRLAYKPASPQSCEECANGDCYNVGHPVTIRCRRFKAI